MEPHELAGKPVPPFMIPNIPKLVSAYYTLKPDVTVPEERISFGTSGHRGSSLKRSFNEDHILAVSQAIVEYRQLRKVTGPLFIGMDPHALSEPALASAVEVFAANKVPLLVQKGLRYTPTPVISHAILTFNRGRREGPADGVVITPSHNPPEDGGFKYNPPHGGPAETESTRWIETRANAIMAGGLRDVRRMLYERALRAETTREHDYITPYVEDLADVVRMEIIAGEGLKIGVDPLGGAAVDYWEPIAERYGLSLKVVNPRIDPTFSFMTVDRDGKVRMDCSSPYAMQPLIRLREHFDIAFGNDPDVDRHGIVTRTAGLLNPNHYLSAAVWYLFQHRDQWTPKAAVGKTLVTTSMLDRVSGALQRRLCEMPVGFKWFVDGLLTGSCAFGGEESAGASFLRRNGTVWTTDKDGIIMDLLACEMTARTGKDPAVLYGELENRFGKAYYTRIDTPATPSRKAALKRLTPEMVTARELAGEPIKEKLTRAPGNNASIDGLKVVTPNGWFAARPSGTEPMYKIYAESFKSEEHLDWILTEARRIVDQAFDKAGV